MLTPTANPYVLYTVGLVLCSLTADYTVEKTAEPIRSFQARLCMWASHAKHAKVFLYIFVIMITTPLKHNMADTIIMSDRI